MQNIKALFRNSSLDTRFRIKLQRASTSPDVAICCVVWVGMNGPSHASREASQGSVVVPCPTKPLAKSGSDFLKKNCIEPLNGSFRRSLKKLIYYTRAHIAFSILITISCQSNFTLMLNPEGDAKNAGRILNDSFERGITLQFCNELKKELEKKYKDLRVVLTRFPGETIEYLQNANFSNRLNADFYLSIHFFKENEVLPNLYIYYFVKEPFVVSTPLTLHFYPFDSAHLININKTIKYAESFRDRLSKNSNFKTNKALGIPFKPLIGIIAPAIAIEAGIKDSESFKEYLEPVLEAIEAAFGK